MVGGVGSSRVLCTLGAKGFVAVPLPWTVMKLAPQESAVEAVQQGLAYLDSSALAALLKELAKQGHIKRSVEIFDWLRGLPSTNELASLCDLYTYTTMISQASLCTLCTLHAADPAMCTVATANTCFPVFLAVWLSPAAAAGTGARGRDAQPWH